MAKTKGNLALKDPWGDTFRDSFEIIEGGAQKAVSSSVKIGTEGLKSSVKVLKNEAVDALVKTGVEQVLFLFDSSSIKGKAKQQHHEVQPQEEKPEKKIHATAAIDYAGEILHAGERLRRRQENSIETKIEEIKIELKQLIATSKQLQTEFKDVVVEQKPNSVGVYHEAFFDWLLTMIHQVRIRVEDSSSWLQAMQSKSSKKKGYWSMFKKHGTMFGMSGERAVATQVG